MLSPDEFLAPDGRLAARVAGWESRPQQEEMAALITEAIDRRRHALVEAGTGVGKSLAYLVPAVLAVTADQAGGAAGAPPADVSHADEPDALGDESGHHRPRRVVISTHTIALQEQLITKDIPLVASVLPYEFSAVLVKGRGNYVSLRRLGLARERSGSLFPDDAEVRELHDLATWARHTSDGSLADLPTVPSMAVWDEIESDSGNCMGRACPTYAQCHYYAARRRMQHAQVLVVNHALFFSDLALRRGGVSLLPPYDVVVFDEAHMVESVASDHLGIGLSSTGIDRVLSKLFNEKSHRGLLVHYRMADLQVDVLRCRRAAEDFFSAVKGRVSGAGPAPWRVSRRRIVPDTLGDVLRGLARSIRSAGEQISNEAERHDFFSLSERLTAQAGTVHAWLEQNEPGSVWWVEASRSRRGRERITLASAPVDVGAMLKRELFDKVGTVVLTSATLAVGGDRRDAEESEPPAAEPFAYVRRRIGLDDALEKRLGSPFDYERQADLILVDRLPDPSDRDAYDAAVVAMIKRYTERSEGRAMVLFTSHASLTKASAELVGWCARKNFRLVSQADGLSRQQMPPISGRGRRACSSEPTASGRGSTCRGSNWSP
jgi:ATP-dependent DNA helicase DinG